MEAILGALKALRPWQIVALAVVLLGSAGATYGIYASSTSADVTALAENQQLIPVQYGTLTNQVSTNGSLAFPEREELTFGTAGTVDVVLVTEGQRVGRGDILAKLDGAVIASLEQDVAQARLDLQTAAEALEDVLESYTALDLAEAEEKVSNARFQLQVSQEALEDAQFPYTDQEIKTQEQAEADARLALQDAQQSLADLVPGNTLLFAQARQAKADADATLDSAQQALADLLPAHSRELATASQTRADAQIALDSATDSLEDFLLANARQVGELRDALVQGEVEFAKAVQNLSVLVELQGSGALGIEELIRRRQISVAARRAELEKARSDLADLDQLEAKLAVAREDLTLTEDALAELAQGPDPLKRQKLEADLQVARADLRVAQDSLAIITAEVDPLELALNEADIALARATLTQAGADLAELNEGADPLDVALKERQIGLAQATLAQAEEDLAELLEDADPLEVALREAQITSAQLGLDEALQLLQDSTLVAPFAGMVAMVGVEDGDEVQANTVIVEIVDPTIIEIDGIVDEIDVLSVREGTRARVSLDAMPGQEFSGVVSEIAPAAQSQQGVVTYPIRIQVQVPEGLEPREGLTAVANILLREESNVLLVPQQAIYGSVDTPVVRVMTALGIVEKPVVLGNTDDFYVAISQGLEEGEEVLLESAEVATSGSSFRDLRRATGGSFGGRGGSRGGSSGGHR